MNKPPFAAAHHPQPLLGEEGSGSGSPPFRGGAGGGGSSAPCVAPGQLAWARARRAAISRRWRFDGPHLTGDIEPQPTAPGAWRILWRAEPVQLTLDVRLDPCGFSVVVRAESPAEVTVCLLRPGSEAGERRSLRVGSDQAEFTGIALRPGAQLQVLLPGPPFERVVAVADFDIA